MTISITTLGRMTISIMTITRLTISIITLAIMTFNPKTLDIMAMGRIVTHTLNNNRDIQQNNMIMLTVIMLSVVRLIVAAPLQSPFAQNIITIKIFCQNNCSPINKKFLQKSKFWSQGTTTFSITTLSIMAFSLTINKS